MTLPAIKINPTTTSRDAWARMIRHEHTSSVYILSLAHLLAPENDALYLLNERGLPAAEFDVPLDQINENTIAAYTEGFCWMIAIELGRCLGLSLMVYSEYHSAADDPGRKHTIEEWTHVAAGDNEVGIVDVRGLHTLQQSFEHWHYSRETPDCATAYRVPARKISQDAQEIYQDLCPTLMRHNWSLTRHVVRMLIMQMINKGQLIVPRGWGVPTQADRITPLSVTQHSVTARAA